MNTVRQPGQGKTAEGIIAAAQQAFLADGYEATSMDNIARQADVSKATLYAHFISKEALFIAVMQELRGSYQQRLTEISAAPGRDFRQRLYCVTKTMAEFLTQPWTLQMFRIIIAESTRVPEVAQWAIQSGREHTHQVLSRLFRSGIDSRELRDHEPEEAAHLFMAILRGSILWESLVDPIARPDKKQLTRDIDTLVTHIHCLYANPDHKKSSASSAET